MPIEQVYNRTGLHESNLQKIIPFQWYIYLRNSSNTVLGITWMGDNIINVCGDFFTWLLFVMG